MGTAIQASRVAQRLAPGCCIALAGVMLAASLAGEETTLPGATAAELNLSFERAAPAAADRELPADWLVGGNGYEVALDREVHRDGARSLRLRYDGPTGKSASAVQRVEAAAFAGKRARLG